MRVLLYPFYSQQDKRTGKFLLASDSGFRAYSYIGRQMLAEGWEPVMLVPPAEQCADCPFLPYRIVQFPYELCSDNLLRRLQWNPDWLAGLDYDLVLTTHEFIAYPLRCLKPGLRIVMECGIRPSTAWPETAALFPLARVAADAVHFNSQLLADECEHSRRKFVWPFGYEERPHKVCKRTIDVVFPARTSSTEYSNHRLFVLALGGTDLAVVMTDPTSYLRSNPGKAPDGWVPPHPLLRADYDDLLDGSKVVVGLTANGYGGYAFQEAVAAGCCPVALRCPEYEELLGADWPYLCSSNPYSLRAAVLAALAHGWPRQFEERVHTKIKGNSYGAAWDRTSRDLKELMQ